LGSFGQNFVGVTDPKFSGEYLAASVTSMGGDLAAGAATFANMAGLKIATSGTSGASKLDLTSIILWTLTAVELSEFTAGFGPPNEGDDLKVGSDQFTTVSTDLASAFPDEHWQGEASQAYGEQDTELQNLAQTMADLDLKLAAIVKNQAEWVTHMRLGFGILKDLLIAAYVIELIMKATAVADLGAGLAASQIFAYTVSAIGIALALGMIGTLIGFPVKNGGDADALTPQYLDACEKAQPSDTPLAKTMASVAAQSTVSSFEDVSAGMSSMSAVPDVSNKVASEAAPAEGGDDAAADIGGGAPAEAGDDAAADHRLADG